MIKLLPLPLLLLLPSFAFAELSISLGNFYASPIVCSPQATESERYAATEFQVLFKGLTGMDLAIIEAAPAEGNAIFIGPDAVAASGKPPVPAELGQEGLRIIVDPGKLYIDGGRPRGTLYGVYEFFENLGVRYLTHDHTYFPPAPPKALTTGEYSYTPPFAFRWSYYGETNRNPAFAARLRTNTVTDDAKLGGKTGYRLVGHNVAQLLPPATYGAEHPEYFALVDGQRKLEMPGGGPQLCFTNPEVLKLVTAAVLKEIESNPTAKNINVAQMDNEAYCTCPDCAAVDAREESHAGAILSFVNAVAEEVEKTHPDVLIGTYAYQYTRKPPKTLTARDNVLIQLCSIECCDFHAINDPGCSLNRLFCEEMAVWNTKAKNIFIWHYNTNFRNYELPFPNFRAIGKSVEYFHQNEGRGVFMQAAGNGFSSELSDLRNYVMSRCLWKPGRDSWTEMEEFVKLHYAESAEPILDYLTWYHDTVDQAGVHPTCFPVESSLVITPETAPKIMAYFQDALQRAQSDAVRARVEKASVCAYRATLSAMEMKLAYADGIVKPGIQGLEPDLIERYAELAAKYEVAMEGELETTEKFIVETRKFHGGVAAVKLENEHWRLVFLPEYNARIVEMTWADTGRNIVQPHRSLGRFRHEEWVRQGDGPGSQSIVSYEVQAQEDTRAVLVHTTADGSRVERAFSLEGDGIVFGTTLTAGAPRVFDYHVHPEYDTATMSADPSVISVYVKSPEWVHANKDWQDALPTEDQKNVIKNAAPGGAFAFYNHEAGFGIEQRFDPAATRDLFFFWNPSRIQVNLELFGNLIPLEEGQKATFTHVVRYLDKPPTL